MGLRKVIVTRGGKLETAVICSEFLHQACWAKTKCGLVFLSVDLSIFFHRDVDSVAHDGVIKYEWI